MFFLADLQKVTEFLGVTTFFELRTKIYLGFLLVTVDAFLL